MMLQENNWYTLIALSAKFDKKLNCNKSKIEYTLIAIEVRFDET